MEVSPTGQPSPTSGSPNADPVALLQMLVGLQSQTLDLQKQIFQNQQH